MDKRDVLKAVCGTDSASLFKMFIGSIEENALHELNMEHVQHQQLFWFMFLKRIFSNTLPNELFDACSKKSNIKKQICSSNNTSQWTNLLKRKDVNLDIIGNRVAEDPLSLIRDLCDKPDKYIIGAEYTPRLMRSNLRHDCLAEWILTEYYNNQGIYTVSDCEKHSDGKTYEEIRPFHFMKDFFEGYDDFLKKKDKEHFKTIITLFTLRLVNSIRHLIGLDDIEPLELSHDHLQQIQEDIAVPEDEPEQISVPANEPVNFFMFQNSIQYGDIESPDRITATDPGKYFNNCSILDTVLKDAFLCGGLLEMCTFNNSELNEANFDNAKISGCRFVRTKIKRSSFQEASLEKNESVWSNDEIVRSKFDEAAIDSVVFSNDLFSNCSFKGTKINSSSVSDSKIWDTVLDSSLITDTSVSKSELCNCSFKTSKLRNSFINECDLSGCSFTDADLLGVSFEGSTISGGDFRNADLRRASFKDVKFFNDVDMYGADLSGADLRGTVMRELTEEWDIIHRPFTCDYRGAKYCEQEPLKTIFAEGYEYIKKDMIEVDINGKPVKTDQNNI